MRYGILNGTVRSFTGRGDAADSGAGYWREDHRGSHQRGDGNPGVSRDDYCTAGGQEARYGGLAAAGGGEPDPGDRGGGGPPTGWGTRHPGRKGGGVWCRL